MQELWDSLRFEQDVQRTSTGRTIVFSSSRILADKAFERRSHSVKADGGPKYSTCSQRTPKSPRKLGLLHHIPLAPVTRIAIVYLSNSGFGETQRTDEIWTPSDMD